MKNRNRRGHRFADEELKENYAIFILTGDQRGLPNGVEKLDACDLAAGLPLKTY